MAEKLVVCTPGHLNLCPTWLQGCTFWYIFWLRTFLQHMLITKQLKNNGLSFSSTGSHFSMLVLMGAAFRTNCAVSADIGYLDFLVMNSSSIQNSDAKNHLGEKYNHFLRAEPHYYMIPTFVEMSSAG